MPIIVAEDRLEYATAAELRAQWLEATSLVVGGFCMSWPNVVPTISGVYEGARCAFSDIFYCNSGDTTIPRFYHLYRVFTGLDPAKTYTARLFHTVPLSGSGSFGLKYKLVVVGNATYSTIQAATGADFKKTEVVFQPDTFGNITLRLEVYDISIGQVVQVRTDWAQIEEGGTITPPVPTPPGDIALVARVDWTEPIVEKFSYLTDVQTADDDSELRVQLRVAPQRSLRFMVSAFDERESGALDAFLWKCQGVEILVPLWMDAQPLLATVSSGATVLSVDTTNREFIVGDYVMLWIDPFTAEFPTIASITGPTITLSAPGTTSGWTATRTWVVPLKRAVLRNSLSIGRPVNWVGRVVIEADLVTIDTTPLTGAPSATQYRGFDVMDQKLPRDDDPEDAWSRTTVFLGGSTGAFQLDDAGGGTPLITRSVSWAMDSRSEISTWRAWLGQRAGRKTGFWLPTYQHDLTLNQDVAANATSLVIKGVKYTSRYFPSIARRDVALLYPGRAMVLRRVSAAVDNGATETLTVPSVGSPGFAAADTMLSFLAWCRMVDDSAELVWRARELATASVALRELPKETP